MKVDSFAFTDTGLKRRVNQDSYVVKCNSNTELYLFAVADGMGGHSHGEKASAKVAEGLQDWMEHILPESVLDASVIAESIKHVILCANKEIYEDFSGEVCGTTLVLLCIWRETYIVFSVGDSRVYRYGNGGFSQITRDDVWELQQDVLQTYTQQEIKEHMEYGKLVTAVGACPELFITYNMDVLDHKINFLLCSDGIYKYCMERDIKRCIVPHGFVSGQRRLQRLKKQVDANGMGDNATAILVMCKM